MKSGGQCGGVELGSEWPFDPRKCRRFSRARKTRGGPKARLLKGGDLHILAALSSAGIAQLVERRIRNA